MIVLKEKHMNNSDKRLKYLLKKRYKTASEKEELEELVKQKGYIYETDGEDDSNLKTSSFFSKSEEQGGMINVYGGGRRTVGYGKVGFYIKITFSNGEIGYLGQLNSETPYDKKGRRNFKYTKHPIRSFSKETANFLANLLIDSGWTMIGIEVIGFDDLDNN